MSDKPDGQGLTVDIVLRQAWAAVEATDKTFFAQNDLPLWRDSAVVSYAVPAAKTLYITQVTVAGYALDAADADNNQIVLGQALDLTTVTDYHQQAGNGGYHSVLDKPLVIPGGDTFRAQVLNLSNHGLHGSILATGYEV